MKSGGVIQLTSLLLDSVCQTTRLQCILDDDRMLRRVLKVLRALVPQLQNEQGLFASGAIRQNEMLVASALATASRACRTLNGRTS